MRVLITGANGQLGQELTAVFNAPGHHEVLSCGRAELDISSRDSVLGTITSNEPDVIIQSAAYTAVDNAETDVDAAFTINTLGTRHVAEAARITGARVVYVSTDYVFDGTLDRPYDEWQQTNPQTVYGRSKLAGERELNEGDTIVRTSWVFGRYGNNIVKTLLKLAATDKPLQFVNDQFGKPTCAADLAQTIYALTVGKVPGTFHVTNEGATNWFDFAQSVFELAGADPQRITPVSTADALPVRPAARPLNSVLDNAALRLTGFAPMADHREATERVVKELLQ